MSMLKKGDRVLIWSLQSFSNGGFLEAEPAFVRQDQYGKSVIVCVIRNQGGDYKIDDSYEIYPQQLISVKKKSWGAKKELRKLRKYIINGGEYHNYS